MQKLMINKIVNILIDNIKLIITMTITSFVLFIFISLLLYPKKYQVLINVQVDFDQNIIYENEISRILNSELIKSEISDFFSHNDWNFEAKNYFVLHEEGNNFVVSYKSKNKNELYQYIDSIFYVINEFISINHAELYLNKFNEVIIIDSPSKFEYLQNTLVLTSYSFGVLIVALIKINYRVE